MINHMILDISCSNHYLWGISKNYKKIYKAVSNINTMDHSKSNKNFYGSLWVMKKFFYSVSHTEYLVALPSPTLCKIPSLSIKAKSLLLISLFAPVIS